MISALLSTTCQRNSNETLPYATHEDFQRPFETEITGVLRLSLQLTADSEKAERCLILTYTQWRERVNKAIKTTWHLGFGDLN